MNRFVERRVVKTEDTEHTINVVLQQHQFRAGLFRSFCRCGLQLRVPYRYHHRVHVSEQIAEALARD